MKFKSKNNNIYWSKSFYKSRLPLTMRGKPLMKEAPLQATPLTFAQIVNIRF